MTTPETQLYLVVAAEIELKIKAAFKKLDRFERMIKHKDAQKLPQFEEDMVIDAFEVLNHIDDILGQYRVLLSIIHEEQPPDWREHA